MNDYGHEPWARANVARGSHSTPEQVVELLASLDTARAELDRRAAEITELGNKLIDAHRRITDLESGGMHPWVRSDLVAALTHMDPETTP